MGRVRRGWTLLTSSERRKRRKVSGLSARQQRNVMKAYRAYKRGTKGWVF